MTNPTTTLDARFSSPDASPTSWEDTVSALQSAQLFWITTVRVDGRPHVTPLVAIWMDDAIHFSTGADEQKEHNLRGNAHVVLVTGSNDWDHGIDVVVEGDAVRATDEALLHRLADAWAAKWDGQWRYDVHDGKFRRRTESANGAAAAGGDAIVFSVTPTKILAFGKGTFSQTRHR